MGTNYQLSVTTGSIFLLAFLLLCLDNSFLRFACCSSVWRQIQTISTKNEENPDFYYQHQAVYPYWGQGFKDIIFSAPVLDSCKLKSNLNDKMLFFHDQEQPRKHDHTAMEDCPEEEKDFLYSSVSSRSIKKIAICGSTRTEGGSGVVDTCITTYEHAQRHNSTEKTLEEKFVDSSLPHPEWSSFNVANVQDGINEKENREMATQIKSAAQLSNLHPTLASQVTRKQAQVKESWALLQDPFQNQRAAISTLSESQDFEKLEIPGVIVKDVKEENNYLQESECCQEPWIYRMLSPLTECSSGFQASQSESSSYEQDNTNEKEIKDSERKDQQAVSDSLTQQMLTDSTTLADQTWLKWLKHNTNTPLTVVRTMVT